MPLPIYIKSLKGDKFALTAEPSQCVLDIKKRIKQVKNLPIEKQKLIYKGKHLEDSIILGQIGVKEEDCFVLMNVIEKRSTGKKETEPAEVVQGDTAKPEQESKEKDQLYLKNVNKLVKLGLDPKVAEQSLTKNGNNLEKSMDELIKIQNQQGINLQNNEAIRAQIIKALISNQQLLSVGENGQIRMSADISRLIPGLAEKNQQLLKKFMQNPNALSQLLEEGNDESFDENNLEIEEYGDENELSPSEHQVLTEITFTEAEQQAILNLMNLGFTREQVIPAYMSCEKNQELTANMLLNQLENGDFEDDQ